MTSPGQTRPDRDAGRRRLPRWVTVVLVLLIVLLLAALAAFGLFVWAFSGGWDGLRPQAEPTDRDVVTARSTARGALSALTADVLRDVPGTELARVRFDQCEHGQNNWKIHDGYTLRCELTDSLVLRPAAPDVASVAGRLDAALRHDGWAQAGSRNEMTQPADAGASYLLTTRTGSYYRTRDLPQELSVTVTVRRDPPGVSALPYDPSVPVEGDVEAYRRALQGPDRTASGVPGTAPVPRVVVRASVRYFEDDR
ncbi:hypothetical protein [Angustibacter sp. Root456]|uniref:hypothetical protein n=1 Tax=Angustibacter sp. Root456 TaxID=1736539 RepID=UPI000701E958|nr:hypothetical protein [Angustibacter sp. Root456]KQX69666.1 hypothetical protein ASD06_01035 [Angustibacter sp. Root456]